MLEGLYIICKKENILEEENKNINIVREELKVVNCDINYMDSSLYQLKNFEKYKANYIFIVEDEVIAKELYQNDFFVVVYLSIQNKACDFSFCNYAIESFEGINMEYLNILYHRFKELPLTILSTKRCRLCEITCEDVDDLYRIYSNPEITLYMEDLFPDREQELAYTKDYIHNIYHFYGYGMWVIKEKQSGKLIGRAGLEFREGEEGIELGFLVAKEYQRIGIAYEVCREILEYAKQYLEFDSIYSYSNPKNVASIRLIEKLGFKYAEQQKVNGILYNKYKVIL